VLDSAVEVGVGELECGVGIDRYWIGDRPVQPRTEVPELFVGVVADGDDEVIVVKDVVEGLGAVAFDAESVALGDVTARGWMRGPGWVPAEVAGVLLSWFQMAAASWERAEFAVHTNSTRGPAGRLSGMRPEMAAAHTVGWSSRS
jgi:hypothetical protein